MHKIRIGASCKTQGRIPAPGTEAMRRTDVCISNLLYIEKTCTPAIREIIAHRKMAVFLMMLVQQVNQWVGWKTFSVV